MSRSINEKAAGYNVPRLILKASTKRRNRQNTRIYLHSVKNGAEPRKEIPAYKRCDDLWNYD